MSILLSRSFYVHPLKPPVPGREKDDKPENLPIIANKQISFGGKEHEKDLFFITGIYYRFLSGLRFLSFR
jgi:hypothetical protein